MAPPDSVPALELKGTSRSLQSAAAQFGPKSFSNIQISGNARVHVGDAYFDHLTINQFCQVREANDAIVHQIGTLRSLSQNASQTLLDPVTRDQIVQQCVNQINNDIKLRNTQLQQVHFSPSTSTTSEKLVSRTRLNFSLIPLGFSFERTVYHDEQRICHAKEDSRSRAQRVEPLVSLRVPAWFAGYQYTICVNRATSGWRFQFRLLVDVPRQTHFMVACKYGWVNRVKFHLSSDAAVVNERFDGLTGADIALLGGNHDLILFLRDAGIKSTITLDHIFEYKPERLAVQFHPYKHDFERYVTQTKNSIDQVCNLFKAEHDDFWETASRWPTWYGSPRSTKLVRTFLKYPRWSQHEAIQSLILMNSPDCELNRLDAKLESAEALIQEFGPRFSAYALRCEGAWDQHAVNIFHCIFKNLGNAIGHGARVSTLWSALIKDAIAASVDVHFARSTLQDVAMTPLVAFLLELLECTPYRAESEFTSIVRDRLRIDRYLQSLADVLLNANIDLLSFGQLEDGVMKRNPRTLDHIVRDRSWGYNFLQQDFVRVAYGSSKGVVRIAYGPTPADWHVEYQSHAFDLTKDFWRLTTGSVLVCDLIKSMLQIKLQNPGLCELSTRNIPGMWPEQRQQKVYKVCEIIDCLVELSLENYELLAEEVSLCNAGARIDTEMAWWCLLDTKPCGTRCQECLDAIAEVNPSILEFDEEDHWYWHSVDEVY